MATLILTALLILCIYFIVLLAVKNNKLRMENFEYYYTVREMRQENEKLKEVKKAYIEFCDNIIADAFPSVKDAAKEQAAVIEFIEDF